MRRKGCGKISQMSRAKKPLHIVRELIAPRSYFALLTSLALLALLSAGVADTHSTRAAVIVLAFTLIISISVAVSRHKHTSYSMFFGGLLIGVMLTTFSF